LLKIGSKVRHCSRPSTIRGVFPILTEYMPVPLIIHNHRGRGAAYHDKSMNTLDETGLDGERGAGRGRARN
jgi:hypothetical protein